MCGDVFIIIGLCIFVGAIVLLAVKYGECQEQVTSSPNIKEVKAEPKERTINRVSYKKEKVNVGESRVKLFFKDGSKGETWAQGSVNQYINYGKNNFSDSYSEPQVGNIEIIKPNITSFLNFCSGHSIVNDKTNTVYNQTVIKLQWKETKDCFIDQQVAYITEQKQRYDEVKNRWVDVES